MIKVEVIGAVTVIKAPKHQSCSGRAVDRTVQLEPPYSEHVFVSPWNNIMNARFKPASSNEIAVYEFKSSNASDAVRRLQQHKSVRLNGVILLDLEQRGVNISNSYPI
ncbi:MAG: hypothetical protein JOS17DRAFT_789336 [Linnemannia elongata]|nr:MAG: hypothetical protein JOS17DRAFT_789336 [Linnemannia elongata]